MSKIKGNNIKYLATRIKSLSIYSYNGSWVCVEGNSSQDAKEAASLINKIFGGKKVKDTTPGTAWAAVFTGGLAALNQSNKKSYVKFSSKDDCQAVIEDINQAVSGWSEENELPSASSDTADYTNAEGAEPEEDDEETGTQAQNPLAALMQNKSLLIVGAVLIAAVVLVLVFVKD